MGKENPIENLVKRAVRSPVGRVALAVLASGPLGIGCQPLEQKPGGIVPPAAARELSTSIPEPTATVVPIIATEIPTAPPPTATGEPTVPPTEPVPPTPTKAVPTPPTTEVKSTPIPEKILTQEEALAKVDEIIFMIENPDPALLQKYPPKFLSEEQVIITAGGIDEKNPKAFEPDSLRGVRASLENGDRVKALKELQKLFPRLSQPIYLTTGQDDRIFWDRKKVLEYDPDGLLIKLDPKWVSWSLSAIKGEAVVKATELGRGISVPTAAK